jgi:hypothetical protein
VNGRQAAVIALAAALILRPLLQLSGLPAFNHDWSWPPSGVQAYTLLHDSMQPYSHNNFGSANYSIVTAPLWAANALATFLFGVVAGLKLLLFVILFFAGCSAAFFVRQLGGGRLAQTVGAIFYAGSPIVANELAAGHVAYLLGYAALPAVAACASILSQRWSVTAALALAALFPLTQAQPQFAFFYAVVCVLAALCAQRRSFALILAAAAVVALLASPYEAALALFGHSAQSLSFDQTNIHWVATNSAPLLRSFTASGYAGNYDLAAGGRLIALRAIAGAALWILAVVLLATSRTSFARAVIVAGFIAALIVAGTNGPFAPILVFLFSHVPAAALFRELYHCAGFVVLALLAALALTRGPRMTLAAAALALIFALPQYTGSFWGFVRSYDPHEMQTVADRIAADPGSGNVLFLPLLQPLGPAGGSAGSDPDAFAIGAHPAIWEFIPRQPMSQIDALLRYRPADVRSILRDFGVRYVVMRPGWRSHYFERAEPALRKIFASHPPPAEQPAQVARALKIELRLSAHELASIPNAKPRVSTALSNLVYRLPLALQFSPNVLTPDPSKAWAGADRWQWWNQSFLGPVNPGVFSLGGVAFELPRPVADGVVANLSGGYAVVRLSQNTRSVVPGKPSILSGYGRLPQFPGAAACGEISRSGERYRVAGAQCKLLTVEALENTNAGWVLRDAGGVAVRPLDTAWDEKWLAPGNRGAYDLRQELGAPLAIALFLQRLVWVGALLALALIIVSMWRRLGWPPRRSVVTEPLA